MCSSDLIKLQEAYAMIVRALGWEEEKELVYPFGHIEVAEQIGKIVTVEEHSVIGGLGSAVCDVVAEKAPAKVMKIGVNDVFGESGPAAQLIKKYGLDGESIYEKVKAFV